MTYPLSEATHRDSGNAAWRWVWAVGFAVVRRSGPVLRLLARLRVPSYASEIVQLAIVGRRTGEPRPVTVAMIEHQGHRYVGHPNGSAAWLTNLGAMDTVPLTIPRTEPLMVRPVPLLLGPERDAVIRTAAHRGPIHVRPLYWASRSHVLRAGVFYRLDPVVSSAG